MGWSCLCSSTECAKLGRCALRQSEGYVPFVVTNSIPVPVPEKKPYKCPVCEGKGNIITPGNTLVTECTETCYPCKATGIIWG